MIIRPEPKEIAQASLCLASFLWKNIGDVVWAYDWGPPKGTGLLPQGSPYRDTILWKETLGARWHQATTEGRKAIAREIISEWGGIRSNSDLTYDAYVRQCSKDNPVTPFKGVSSYSKILAIVQPDCFAIYDARVAVALNAIQYLERSSMGLAFKYPPGRNRITGNPSSRTGFSYDARFSAERLIQRGWTRIEKDETYRTYMKILHLTLPEFPTHRLHDLEMALFCNAERLALKAMYDEKSQW